MKRNQIVALILLVIVIGGLGLYLYQREGASWESPDQLMGTKVLKDFPLNDIAHVTIQEGTNTINLVKKEDQWTVQERNNYPANFSEVGRFLQKLWELTVTQPQNVSVAQLGRFELLPPSAETNSSTKLEFKDKDGKLVRTLLLGKKHMKESAGDSPFGGGGWPDGRYVMVGDDIKTVALVNDPLSDAEARADKWLDKDFFKVEKAKAIAVAARESTNSWKVVRETETGEWKLVDAGEKEELDKTKTSGLNSILSYPSFTDILAKDAKPEELGLDQPRVATIETFDKFTYQIKTGTTNAEGNYPIQISVSADITQERKAPEDEKPEDKERLDKEFAESKKKLEEKLGKEKRLEGWTYVVSKWTIDSLLKNRSELVTEKKPEEEKKEEPKPVETSASAPKGPKPPPLIAAPEGQLPPLPPVKTNTIPPPPPPPAEKPAETPNKPGDTPPPDKPPETPAPDKPADTPPPEKAPETPPPDKPADTPPPEQ